MRSVGTLIFERPRPLSRQRRANHLYTLICEEPQYAKERKAFGKPIGSFQNSRFVLAELATEATAVRIMVDEFIRLHLDRKLTIDQAAMAKWYSTEAQVRLVDRCLQLHGGYGYMREYPIARAFLDSRIQTIYGGTTEIMKEIIGRGLGV